MSAQRTASRLKGCDRQHGAALMVMLVVLIIGAAAILVGVLSSSSLQIERDKTTADALAKAKAALIAYAVSDGNRPGELPCPDVNDDGMITVGTDYSGSNCASPIGRIPWKTLGLTELRDGNGEHLWYAVSKTFWANGTATINSDAQGNLNVSGTSTASNVIAIVFAPGATLSGQSRSTTQTAACTTTGTTVANNLCATNYLELSNANLSTTGTPNTTFQTAAASSTFNDQMIYITHDQLLAPVEMRIAREAKKCLDDYAADTTNTYHRYPWAAPDSDTTSYTGSYNTLFGRIPASPLTMTAPVSIDTNYALPMLNALSGLQTALNAYSANINATTTSALLNSAQALITAAQNADTYGSFASYSSITGNADTAGDRGRDLANGVGGYSVSTVQNYINNTNSYLNSNGFIDDTMPKYWSWPTSCVFASGYWSAWQNEVFYQVASGNRPGSPVSTCNTTCLTINVPSPTYRAAVLVARKMIGAQVRTTTSNLQSDTNFMEGTNQHATTPSTTFETYSPSDPSYSSVNDLVVCLDGAGINPSSVCK